MNSGSCIGAPMILRVWMVVVSALVVLVGLACARRGDRAFARGTTVVMAVPNIEVLKPDVWDLGELSTPFRAEPDTYMEALWVEES